MNAKDEIRLTTLYIDLKCVFFAVTRYLCGRVFSANQVMIGVASTYVLFIGTAYADDVSQRYPWDSRPAYCFTDGEASRKDADCIAHDWFDFHATTSRISHLYNSEKFVLLDRAMKEIVSSNEQFITGRSAVSAIYWAFRELMPSNGARGNEMERISRWKAAVPDSYFVPFAIARHQYSKAWNARGTGYSSSASKETWELFTTRLQAAEQTLLDAPKPLKETPLWHNLLLAISLDSDRVKSDRWLVFGNAVQKWPEYYDFYDVMLSRLVPKWGGSWTKVDAFINEWTEKNSIRGGRSLYARLYSGLRYQRVSPEETLLDWSKMKQGLVDLVVRYPAPEHLNLYASYACYAKDKEAFGDAMSRLTPDTLDNDKWLEGHSYDACMQWARV